MLPSAGAEGSKARDRWWGRGKLGAPEIKDVHRWVTAANLHLVSFLAGSRERMGGVTDKNREIVETSRFWEGGGE